LLESARTSPRKDQTIIKSVGYGFYIKRRIQLFRSVKNTLKLYTESKRSIDNYQLFEKALII